MVGGGGGWEGRGEEYSLGGKDQGRVVKLCQHVLYELLTELALLSDYLLCIEGKRVVIVRATLFIALEHIVCEQFHSSATGRKRITKENFTFLPFLFSGQFFFF